MKTTKKSTLFSENNDALWFGPVAVYYLLPFIEKHSNRGELNLSWEGNSVIFKISTLQKKKKLELRPSIFICSNSDSNIPF